MAYPYNFKVVVSGKHVEVYKYKKQVWREFEKKNFEDEKPQKEPKQLNAFEQMEIMKQKQQYSVNRTRTEIRRLINSNPQLTKFMTLTFAKNITDLKEANYIFNQFIKSMNYKYPDFKYLAIPEFQQRGAVHYHLLCEMPFIHFREIAEIWGQGNIDIRTLNDVDNIGAYVCKYLSKDMFDERTFGKKKFFRSQSLSEPIELLGYWAMKFVERVCFALKPVFENKFESEWVGEVEYQAYKLDFIPFKRGKFERSILFKPI